MVARPVGDEIMSYDLLYNIIDILEDIAGETRKTVAQVALNWLLQRPTICSLVIGARYRRTFETKPRSHWLESDSRTNKAIG